MPLRQFIWVLLTILASTSIASATPPGGRQTLITQATYEMAEHDTLADAERLVLLRAQRHAVERTGIYLETVSRDVATIRSGKDETQRSSLAIRTLAAGIVETTVLERRIEIQNDRPVFFVKIRATVDLSQLEAAIRQLHREDVLAIRAVKLVRDNAMLREELAHLRRDLHDTRGEGNSIRIESPEDLLRAAARAQTPGDRITLVSRAISAYPRDERAYLARGHAYLGMATETVTMVTPLADRQRLVDQALADFSQALSLRPLSTWALFGQGQAFAAAARYDAAVEAFGRVLAIDPLFDLARERMMDVAMAGARRRIAHHQWALALVPLNKLLGHEPRPSWVADQAEAYLLRSRVRMALDQPERAAEDLTTVLETVPTHARAFFHRGQLLLQMGAVEPAHQDLARACDLGIHQACEGYGS